MFTPEAQQAIELAALKDQWVGKHFRVKHATHTSEPKLCVDVRPMHGASRFVGRYGGKSEYQVCDRMDVSGFALHKCLLSPSMEPMESDE